MEKKCFTINKQVIAPGESTTIMLPMPELYDCTPLSMPVHVIRGKEPGPILGLSAAIHGDEINGIEIIRRILKKRAIKKIRGTLIAIPIVNIFGFLYQDRYLMDRRDLNRSFPGSVKGSLAARLAHLLIQEVVSKTTHFIDLHSGSLHRFNLPQIRANFDIPGTEKMANSFNVPVVLHAAIRDGSLRQYACDHGIPLLLYEAGEALRFDELSIKTGVSGIMSVMNELGMIAIKQTTQKKFPTLRAQSSYWIRAPHSGIIQPCKNLGMRIEKGECLAKLGNPSTIEDFPLISPLSGIIIGQNKLPVVHEGAALFHIACFEKPELVAEQIEYLQVSHGEHPQEIDSAN